MKGKTVLVTGANGGIGIAIVKKFLSQGCNVVAHFRERKDELDKIDSPNLSLYSANLFHPQEVHSLCEQIKKDGKKIDIIVNNAGAYKKSPTFEEIPMEDFDEIMQINLKAPMKLCQFFLPQMKKNNWGRIVNLSSSNVKHGGAAASVHYTISKSSLEVLARAIAKEGAAYNILCNSVRIGFTDTSFHSKNAGKNMDQRLSYIMLKRMAKPEEMAEVVFFLSSDESSFITGAVIDADGGE